MTTMQELGEFLTQDMPKQDPANRLHIRFDPETQTIYPMSKRRSRPLVGAVLLHYKESIRKTPTGGRYFAKRMTIRYKGKKWFGQVKNGTDVVILRLAD